jgi:hypothetical protein
MSIVVKIERPTPFVLTHLSYYNGMMCTKKSSEMAQIEKKILQIQLEN